MGYLPVYYFLPSSIQHLPIFSDQYALQYKLSPPNLYTLQYKLSPPNLYTLQYKLSPPNLCTLHLVSTIIYSDHGIPYHIQGP